MTQPLFNVASLLDALNTTRSSVVQVQQHCIGQRKQYNGVEQHVTHGLAWYYTMASTIEVLHNYALRLQQQQRLNNTTAVLIGLAVADTWAAIYHGVAMHAGEYIRAHEIDLDTVAFKDTAMLWMQQGNSAAARAYIAQALCADTGQFILEDDGLDETAAAVREQFVRFARQHIAPYAQQWHLNDDLLPDELITHMAQAGVFSISAPEAFGGLGMGKTLMCVVSEELSRAYLGAGSLATRCEIASDLLLIAGTPEQQQHYLPALLSGACLPTAVFTEPAAGSDLANLQTTLTQTANGYVLNGAKTWITHAVRADLCFVLARSEEVAGAHGLSMVLLPKTRGTRAQPFDSTQGINGSEIQVLGYRGMCEYEMTFANTPVPADAVLGQQRGKGFVQLMQTFETARIQTAARAVGVAQAALDCAVKHARDRTQFGKPLIAFGRIRDKLALMAVDVLRARQITYAAAQQKDAGGRCDMMAGMAKMVAARTAWICADNNVQIHGGTGYALEHEASRLLCDARVLMLFEGASEIQAEVVSRGLKGL